MIRICPTGELETSSSPILCQFFSSIRRQAPDAKYPDGMSAEKNSGCDTSGWNGGGAKFRMWDIRVECRPDRMAAVIHPDKVERWPGRFQMWDIRVEWAMPQPTLHRPPMVCLDALSEHLLHGFERTLLNLGLLWWSKSYQNTKT